MKEVDDSQFINSITQQLDKHASKLDPSILSRLDSAREQALSVLNEQVEAEGHVVDTVVSQLKESEALPMSVELKLNQIRKQALSRPQSQAFSVSLYLRERYKNLLAQGIGLTSGMIATACLILTVAALFYRGGESNGIIPIDEEMGLIASSEELELYENLDFYLWLAENELLN